MREVLVDAFNENVDVELNFHKDVKGIANYHIWN